MNTAASSPQATSARRELRYRPAAELVEAAVGLAAGMGRPIASPEQLRARLQA